MNVKQLATLVAFAFAGTAALADDITIDTTPFTAQKTRAEVKAEVLAARAAGIAYAPTEVQAVEPATASTLTREQVRAELSAAPKARVAIYNDAA